MEAQKRYTPVRLHRVGGMGKLWVARDVVLDRDVCLKVVRADADREAHVQFDREAKIGGHLRHPNIVPVHDYGNLEWPDDGDILPHLFIAQTFINGYDLKRPIQELCAHGGDAPQSPRRALLNIYMRVLDAMAYAHGEGVVHRDLKPANVLFDPTLYFTYVVDWGLAKRVGERDVSTDARVLKRMMPDISMPGTIKGTPLYISPEQARGDVDKLDSRSDIYSLGVMLYEILTYTTPLRDDDPYRLIDRIVSETLVSPRAYLEREHECDADPIPRELDEIVMHCLQKEPGARYQSAIELKEALEAHLMHDVPAGTLTTFEPGAVILSQGDKGGDLYYLISGEVVIERDGKEIGRSREGWLGTIGTFSGKRAATVKAVMRCRAYTFTDMSHPRLIEQFRKDPAMAIGLLEDLARNLVDTERRMKEASR